MERRSTPKEGHRTSRSDRSRFHHPENRFEAMHDFSRIAVQMRTDPSEVIHEIRVVGHQETQQMQRGSVAVASRDIHRHLEFVKGPVAQGLRNDVCTGCDLLAQIHVVWKQIEIDRAFLLRLFLVFGIGGKLYDASYFFTENSGAEVAIRAGFFGVSHVQGQTGDSFVSTLDPEPSS